MIITLLTDFGTSDYFVAAMKGVILSVDPRIVIVDITHEVPPHDVRGAAFQLAAVSHDFPRGTVHAVVVDPGVGSSRLPIALALGGHYFVGPDNGVFDMLAGDENAETRELVNPAISRAVVSPTFHGRDIFAPAAAALASGFPFSEVGPTLPSRSAAARRAPHDGPRVTGSILHIDRFGNCITSFRASEVDFLRSGFRIVGRDWEVADVRRFYVDGPAGTTPFVIGGSAGYLEISICQASAAAALRVSLGDRVEARFAG